MAEAVAVVRAKRAAEAAGAHGEAESQFPRSMSLLEEKFDAYEQANLMIFRSKSDGAPSSSSTRDSGPLDTPDGSFGPANAELATRGARTSLRLPDSATGGEDFANDDAEARGAWGGGTGGGGGGGGGGASRREGLGNERAGISSSSSSGSSSGSGSNAEDDERGSLGAVSLSCRPQSTRERHGEGCVTAGKGSSRETRRGGEGDSCGNEHAESGGDALGEACGGGTGGTSMRRGGAEEGVGAPLMRSFSEDRGRNGVACPRSESVVQQLHDTEMDEMDGEVLQEAFTRVLALQKRVLHYRDLGGFVLLMALFITILYLQADSSRSYDITAAHSVLYPPVSLLLPYLPPPLTPLSPSPLYPTPPFPSLSILLFPSRTHSPLPPYLTPPHPPPVPCLPSSATPVNTLSPTPCADGTNTFAGADDFYQWLNNSIIQTLWADFTCGDGTCNRPFQYPAFGRFGCQADCGTFPNLTSVVVRLSSQLHTQEAAEQSSWNLCMVNPVSLCWYEAPQPFPQGEVDSSVPLDIPDGDWVVVLNAPLGGIRGTLHAAPPGTRRLAAVGSSSTVELASWGYCAHGKDGAETDGSGAAVDDAGSAGAVAGSDICRYTCVRLATCLPEACHRTFTEREVAGAFVDCARMCIIAPAAISPYAASSCPFPDMPTIFPNTPCNASACQWGQSRGSGCPRYVTCVLALCGIPCVVIPTHLAPFCNLSLSSLALLSHSPALSLTLRSPLALLPRSPLSLSCTLALLHSRFPLSLS
ncbi:unnamed protein product [Closterium sp. NIES-65]|nr:unnamed protein product [Closterium sp. NIES-65]